MNGRIWLAVVILLAGLFGVACGGESVEGGDDVGVESDVELDVGEDPDAEDSGEDVGEDPDVGEDVGDPGEDDGGEDVGEEDAGSGDGDEPDVCVPVTQCADGECGDVDDGCGGEIFCGACDCVDGVPNEPTCGACGLGMTVCSGSTATCEMPDIPGFVGDCSEVVFVHPGGSSTGDGSAAAPLRDLQGGIDLATSSGARLVVVAGDDATLFEGPLTIGAPVSLLGGYDLDFQRDPGARPLVETAQVESSDEWAHTVGLQIEGVTLPLVVEGLRFDVADAVELKRSNYALVVKGSNNVTFRDVYARAGRAGHGVDGEQPPVGMSGEPGAVGSASSFGSTPGAGGENPDCPASGGGGGGPGETSETQPQSGESGADAAGGGPGGTHPGTNNPFPARDGEDGPELSGTGSVGAGGTAAPTISGGWWSGVAASGTDGGPGLDGSGGGGGGGAKIEPDGESGGSAGGGGGAGGCGGEGGDAGSSGGGSFALFVDGATVTLEDVELVARRGGDGGAGGSGGQPGLGAPGAGGAAFYRWMLTFNPPSWENRPYDSEYIGGAGGHGADGQPGGHGGGGAGGPSVGILCSDATVSQSGTSITVGLPSAGGSSSGNSGQNGLAVDAYGCD